MNYDTDVASDLYQAGYGDDGHPFIAEAYFVEIQYEDGRRFRHERTFLGARRIIDDEDGVVYFQDVRDQSQAQAEQLAERVRRGGINFQYWEEMDPAYGSEAYINQHTELKRAHAERMEG